MFQTDSLMPWRTALGNVMAGLEFRGLADAEARRRPRTGSSAWAWAASATATRTS